MRRLRMQYYSIFVTSFILSLLSGWGLGKLYADIVLIILPDFLLNAVSHLLIFGVVTGFLLLPMENKLIWGRFFDSRRLMGANRYNAAPISLGLLVGFVSPWVI